MYSDFDWGPDKGAQPTFIIDELKKIVEVANSSGRPVVALACTVEGMRRSITAGVSTIEHGNNGTPEIFKLMKENNIASDAYEQYGGWKKSITPEPESIKTKRKSFADALKSGVTICMGGDAGVFAHGDNAREMEMMVDNGMNPADVLRSSTSINADVFKINKSVGRIKQGLLADILIVEGDPSKNIKDIRKVNLVMKNGISYVGNF